VSRRQADVTFDDDLFGLIEVPSLGLGTGMLEVLKSAFTTLRGAVWCSTCRQRQWGAFAERAEPAEEK
jgi:hypothetical protein